MEKQTLVERKFTVLERQYGRTLPDRRASFAPLTLEGA